MTYADARVLLEQRVAAIGKKPWFFQWRARKQWHVNMRWATSMFALDMMNAHLEVAMSNPIDAVRAIQRAQDQWGVARVEDGEVN